MNGWRSVPLKYLATRITRGSAPTYAEDGDDGGALVIGQSCQRPDGTVDLARARRHTSDASLSLKGRVTGREIVVNSTGTGTLGRVGLLPPNFHEPTFVDTHVTLIDCDSSRAEPRYVARVLQLPYFASFAEEALSFGATKQRELDREALRSHPVLIAGVDEQRRIADFLDRETERIAALDAAARGIVAASLDRLEVWFTEELARQNAPRVPLSRVLVSLSDGPFGSSLASEHYVEDEAVRVIRLGNVGRAHFRDDDRVFVSDEYGQQLSAFAVQQGDVIIAGLGDERHPVGRSCVVPAGVLPAIHKADCFRAVVRPDKITPDFLAWTMSFGETVRKTALVARGATRPRLNTGLAKTIPVPLPALAEQAAVVKEAGSQRELVDKVLTSVEELRRRLAEYRDALITEAVTGQLDVTRVSDAQMNERAHAALEGEPLEVVR